jgi:GTP-binding protein
VDLPGYGYAKVPMEVKRAWQANLSHYLEVRASLRGLVLLMDIRHPLKDLDCTMIHWAFDRELPVHVLLTKSDKLSRSQIQQSLMMVRKHYELLPQDLFSIQSFSATKKQGLDECIAILNGWFEWGDE